MSYRKQLLDRVTSSKPEGVDWIEHDGGKKELSVGDEKLIVVEEINGNIFKVKSLYRLDKYVARYAIIGEPL
jgi:hypothetical protein